MVSHCQFGFHHWQYSDLSWSCSLDIRIRMTMLLTDWVWFILCLAEWDRLLRVLLHCVCHSGRLDVRRSGFSWWFTRYFMWWWWLLTLFSRSVELIIYWRGRGWFWHGKDWRRKDRHSEKSSFFILTVQVIYFPYRILYDCASLVVVVAWYRSNYIFSNWRSHVPGKLFKDLIASRLKGKNAWKSVDKEGPDRKRYSKSLKKW